MRVALYYPWVYLTSGAERVLLHVTGRSRHQWTLFTNRYQPESTFPALSERQIVELDRVSVDRRLGPTVKTAWKIARQRLPVQDYDALVVVCEGLGDLILTRNSGLPTLNICLTPLRIVFDPEYRAKYMSGRGWLQRTAVSFGSVLFRWIDRLLWLRYDRVFCISAECAARVVRGGLARQERLSVLHVGLGFEPENPSNRFDPYFLVPGRIMWTKNIELAIQSYARFVQESPEFAHFRLVVAGIVDEKSKPYLAQLRQLAAAYPGIEFRVFPSDEELQKLYENCYCVLFTAFNEDWGIVPIEGMAFGKPVVAVNSGGPKESVVDGVQGYLEPPQPQNFARRMVELAADPTLARQMGLAGHARAKRYSWASYTKAIDDALDELAAARAEVGQVSDAKQEG